MTIIHGECGHIKARWDNHDKCLRCTSCSRESTRSKCISWTNKTWKLAEKRRTYSSRNWVMKKKHNKKQQVLSDSSDENLVNGITTPHGPAARGRTYLGGNFKGTCTQGSASPPATCHRSTGHQSFTHKTRRHHRSTGHQSPVNQSLFR